MSGIIKINTINELTTDSGVVINGVTVKDSGLTVGSAITLSYLESGDHLAYITSAKEIDYVTLGSNITIAATIIDTIQPIQTTSAVTFGSITLTSGGTANEVSIDGTLGGNSDSAIPTEKAVKTYVDNYAQGIKWKTSVITATTANITLTNEQTVDGIVLVAGNRVLVKNQTLSETNGIYTVVNLGAWTRTTDADSWTDVVAMAVIVETGTVNLDSMYICNADLGGTLETTAITFTKMNPITAHNNLLSIQGGTTNEYYHLTSAEHTELTVWMADVTLSDGGSVNLGTGSLTSTDVTVTSSLSTDNIVEYTLNNGVTLENMTVTSNGSSLITINVPTGYTYSFQINSVPVMTVS